ncbi:Fic family protein [Endozoicomonas lisbonensis]|uniref:Fic family protein n=1 Tax=Endozoicomonas lisbonensis TaxID=3120522 RepID=UPI0033994343
MINGWIYVTEKLSQLEGTPQVDIAFIKEIHRNIAEHDSRFNPGIFFSEMSPGEPSTIYVPLAHQKLESVKFYDLDGLTEAETRHSRQMETLWSQKKSRGLPYVFCFASSAQVGSGAPVFIPLPEGKARALLENREQPEALLKVLQDIFYHLKYDQRDVDISRRLERLYGGGSGDGDKEKYWLNQWAEHIRQRGGQTVLSMSVSEGVELLMAACLKSLNKALSEVNSREQLFKVICSHISEMIALHPFDSANGRTFCLLMQYLLMAYGFPPATFDSPGIFAYGSHDRQLQELERSVEASRIVLECGGQKSFYLHGYQAKGSEKSVFKSTAKIFHQQRQRQQSALKAAESRPSAPLANRRSTLLLSSLCH